MPHRELTHYAVSVVGADRPGIVAGVTEALYKLGCNIADSSCAMLAGEFAMILIVSHRKPFTKANWVEELKPVCDDGMTVCVICPGNRGKKRGEIFRSRCMALISRDCHPGDSTLADARSNHVSQPAAGTDQEPFIHAAEPPARCCAPKSEKSEWSKQSAG